MTKSILVVEDDDCIRDTMKEILESEGFDVHSSENGKKALEFLSEVPDLPGVILLDLMMPVMDGFQFCENKKSDLRLSSIPVVVMSADGHVSEKKTRTKAVAYFKKPVDIDDMINTVKEVLA